MAGIGSAAGAAIGMMFGIPPQFGAAGGSAIEDSFFSKKKKGGEQQDDGTNAAIQAVLGQQMNDRYGGTVGMGPAGYGDPSGADAGMGGDGDMEILSMLMGSMGGAEEEEEKITVPEQAAYVPPTLTGLSKTSPHGVAIQQALSGMRGF